MSEFRALCCLKTGEKGVIYRFENDQLAAKLLSMGLLPGKSLTLVRRIPMGGGLYLKVGNHNFAVREEEARDIILEI